MNVFLAKFESLKSTPKDVKKLEKNLKNGKMIKDQPYLKQAWVTDSFTTAFYFINNVFVDL